MNTLPPDLLSQFMDKYGKEEQLLQTMGECGKLIAVIQNFLRAQKYGNRTESIKDVMKETVDVFFMIQQIRYMWPSLFDYYCSQFEIKARERLKCK